MLVSEVKNLVSTIVAFLLIALGFIIVPFLIPGLFSFGLTSLFVLLGIVLLIIVVIGFFKS